MGGMLCTNTGAIGTGKTALLVHQTRRLFEHKQKIARSLREGKVAKEDQWVQQQISRETIYWIGDENCQWRRFPERVAERLFLIEQGLKLKFYQDGVPIKLKSIPFHDFDDVVGYASPYKLNVVYFRDPTTVMGFIEHLIAMPIMEWSSVAVDEIEYICPSYLSGDLFDRVQEFAGRLAKARKRRVSLYATVQQEAQLDYRVPAIIPYRGLCPGARPPRGWKIWDETARSLNLGEAHIANKSGWQKIKFPPYTKPGEMLAVGLPAWITGRDRAERAKGIMAGAGRPPKKKDAEGELTPPS